MSPMWLTSNTPTAPRTPLCSATSPPLDGYSTGISQPPKLTIFAPNRRCSALRGVLRSSLTLGEFAASIPHARADPRAEVDTNTRSKTRQKHQLETLSRKSRPESRSPYVDTSHLTIGTRLAALRPGQVHSFWRLTMPAPITCSQCDKTEPECTCEKYCTICKGQDKVRLCADGLYYCPDCREACDVRSEEHT